MRPKLTDAEKALVLLAVAEKGLAKNGDKHDAMWTLSRLLDWTDERAQAALDACVENGWLVKR